MSTRMTNGRTRAGERLLPAHRRADLFFEDLVGGEALPQPAPAPARGAAALSDAGPAWAFRVFDEIARRGRPSGGLVSALDGAPWEVVAMPGALVATADLRPGDLVVRRPLGRAQLPSLLVLGASIQREDLQATDQRLRADTLVLRARRGPPGPTGRGEPPPPWSLPGGLFDLAPLGADAEAVPTFSVGSPEVIPRRFVEMPAQIEDWIPNADGTGVVLAQLACRTMDQLTAVLPAATTIINGSPTPLWQAGAAPAHTLEAALDLLVYHPAASAGATTLPAGRHPLAIVCMGNHDPDDGVQEIPSHFGYSGFLPGAPAVATGPYLQEALAERGIVSVSVSTNAANLLGLMIETRARLVVAAIRRMQQLDRDPASRYRNKIDFHRVALIGHSRGGDAVVRAVRLAPSDVRVRAVVQLAPTDISGVVGGAPPPAPALPPNAPPIRFATSPNVVPAGSGARQLIVWGSRDGDVSGFGDARSQTFGNPFRHYDRSSVDRAFQFWHGATHNRFNRLWTDADEDQRCLTRLGEPGLMSRADQEARTVEMVRGWLLFSLFDEATEAALFDGRTPTAVAPALKIASMWKFGRRFTTIDQFDDLRPDLNSLGGANVTPPTGVYDEITIANENGAGAGVTAYQIVHGDRGLRFSPAPALQGVAGVSAPTWRTTIPPGARDFRRFDVLTFRVTKKYDPTALHGGTAAPPVVRVRLRGATAGASQEQTAVGRLSSLPVLRLLPQLPPPCPAVDLDLTKVHYETWEVDLAAYPAALRAAVHFVELVIDTEVGQPAYIDTLSLVKRP